MDIKTLFKKVFPKDTTVDEHVFIERNKMRQIIQSLRVQGMAVKSVRSKKELDDYVNDQKKALKSIECFVSREHLLKAVDTLHADGDVCLMRVIGTPANNISLVLKGKELPSFKGWFCVPIKYFSPELRFKVDAYKKQAIKKLLNKSNIVHFLETTGGHFNDDFKQKLYMNKDAAWEEIWRKSHDKFVESLGEDVKAGALADFGEKTYRITNNEEKLTDIAITDFLPNDKLLLKNYYIKDYFAFYDQTSWLKHVDFVSKIRRSDLKYINL